jgi:leucyl aminopeptidase
MTRPNTLAKQFTESADEAADPALQLELVDEDFEDIQSKLDSADINNTGNKKYRGAQTAAAFVMSGAPDQMPMVHLDIAGGDMSDDEKATGIATPALIQYLLKIDAGEIQIS